MTFAQTDASTEPVAPDTLPGSLGAVVAALGERAVIHHLYGERGARVYHDSTHLDASEIRVMRRVLRRHDGPVLELAAGSGRLTVPLLRMGREVTAIELNPSMIDLLHEHVGDLPEQLRRRLTVHCGDMSDFDLRARFAVVVLGAASISILDEDGRARMFAAVRRHLAPGGVLLFSIVIPGGGQAGAAPGPAADDIDTDVVMDVTGASGKRYRVHEYRAAGAVERLVGVYPLPGDGDPVSGTGPVPVCVGLHRVLSLESMQAEVHRAGLVTREQHAYTYAAQGLSEVFLEVGEAP
ncbi:daptide-type RiPP biosynthesis methyltransferase [Rhizomonospora bruguierae]|uniref:daptide-type RiPP biosynthesis methyltransferase n=1 Tax=Rhizomonospora bruguierae TaxID=1581705 RepID=UPI001BD034B5|nr:daptide-type RiPP biosynthesis methyltransferase [Micromonospora sp. NBRC 107566]